MDNYIVSARKYRPMTFSTVVGQDSLTTTLKNAVKSGKLAHAYLFCGPRGVGKTTCARIFAKTINCEHPTADGEACNECPGCKMFNEGRSMNILELDAASNNSVENIKSLMEQTQIPPQTGKYKVFIIDEVHMLSSSAFNAFLKTLEEPPAHVIFILATTEKHKILPTILSRCQIYDFDRMSVPKIIDHLKMVSEKEHIRYEDEALNVIAEKADGGMRDALSIFDQVAGFTQGNITYEKVLEDLNVLDAENYFNIIDHALSGRVSDILLLLDGIIAKGFDGGHFINGLASHVRNVMMARDAQTLPLLEVSERQKQKYQQQAAKCPLPFLYKSLKILNDCDINYRTSSNKRLLVELTLIRVAQLLQAEDEDASGAGRSPKRLKSLFKNIKTQMPQPVKQVAGAHGQREEKKTQEPTTAIGRQNTNVKEATEHKAATVKEVRPRTAGESETQPEHTTFRNIGMTFRSLKPQKKEAQPQNAHTNEKEPASEGRHFSEEEVSMQWTLMCNRMPKEMIGLSSRLKNINPRITTYPNVEAVVDNTIFLQQVTEIKNNIRATLRKTLHNDNIEFSVRLVPKDEMRHSFTKRELFDKLRTDNPAIEKLRSTLGLELA